jgi:hypothetical protein
MSRKKDLKILFVARLVLVFQVNLRIQLLFDRKVMRQNGGILENTDKNLMLGIIEQ